MEEKPYIEKEIRSVEYHFNPKYGDNRLCTCGHIYYRHFDSHENMEAVGCKYCGCNYFTENPDTRLRYLSPQGRDNVVIADYVGLVIRYVNTYHPEEDTDMQIDCPDFLDHDTQLMYLYEEDEPYDKLKFDYDWNWLMPVLFKINKEKLDEKTSDKLNSVKELWTEWRSFELANIGQVFRGLVSVIEVLNENSKNLENEK